MKAGFGVVDITPRVGVELYGFGPYLNRHSIAVRDRIEARAAAFDPFERTVGSDVVGVLGDELSPVFGQTVAAHGFASRITNAGRPGSSQRANIPRTRGSLRSSA